MADTGHHIAVPIDGTPDDRDICKCAHPRSSHSAHFGGTCLRALTKTAAAAGRVHATQASVCPCDGFRHTGIRWVPPDDEHARWLLKHGRTRAEHPTTLSA